WVVGELPDFRQTFRVEAGVFLETRRVSEEEPLWVVVLVYKRLPANR
ncbi:MAG: hypothetical protein ACI814_001413, partial [Mariniblastus sp.]